MICTTPGRLSEVRNQDDFYRALAAYRDDDREQALRIRRDVLRYRLRVVSTFLANTEEIRNFRIADADRTFRDLRQRLVVSALVIFSVTLLISIGTAYLVVRSIAVPLSRLSQAMATIRPDTYDFATDYDPAKFGSGETAQLGHAFNKMATDLRTVQDQLLRKERLSSIGQVTATVSHELRNPLGAIRSGIDVIKKFTVEAPPHMNRAVALIERAEGRCNAIITDLLDFTRAHELDRTAMAVDDWLENVLDEFVPPPDLSLRRELNAGVSIELDHERLRRVVQNVLDNACQALDGDGEVRTAEIAVTTAVAGDRVEITISDNGPGIAPADLELIFEPLFTTKSIGVGLGLPMVRQIMEQHGGGVEITSELDRGTRVVLGIPLQSSA